MSRQWWNGMAFEAAVIGASVNFWHASFFGGVVCVLVAIYCLWLGLTSGEA